jgi:hypothetical protein
MSLLSLWLPIVLSAVLVFVASSLIHMVLKWHMGDYRQMPNEDAVRAAIRAANPAPGQYFLPYCADHKLMRTPEFQKKFEEGPVGHLTLRPNGFPGMGPSLAAWFVYNLAISAIAACLACEALRPGAAFGSVAMMAGVAAFLAYAGGPIQQWIWMGKPLRSAALEVVDAIIYAVITGCILAWLWPHA